VGVVGGADVPVVPGGAVTDGAGLVGWVVADGRLEEGAATDPGVPAAAVDDDVSPAGEVVVEEAVWEGASVAF
jgi:hypothetical protein